MQSAITISPVQSTPRPRTLQHPGPFNPVRIHSMRCNNARHVRLTLAPGDTLFDALVKPLAAMGIKNASTTILGGQFDDLYYCVAPPDPSRQAVIRYSQPIHAGSATMIFGNATLGKDCEGHAMVHCHAAICTENGEVKGGHIITQICRVGRQPISVLVTSLEGFELRVCFDSETNISLLQPQLEQKKENCHA